MTQCRLSIVSVNEGMFVHQCDQCETIYTSRHKRLSVTCKDSKLPDCKSKGGLLRTEKYEICGCDGKLEPIYQCELFGECSVRKYKVGQSVRSCLSCDNYSAD